MAEGHSSKPISEEKTASASYIITFYQNVQQLTATYSNYLNYVVILENQYKGVAKEKIAPESKDQLISLCSQLRYYATACYIQFNTMAKHLSIKKDAELENLQNEMETKLILDRSSVKSYVLKMNEVLASEVMKSLLISSQSIVDSIYNDNATGNNTQLAK